MANENVHREKASIERCIGQIRRYYSLPSHKDFANDRLRQDAIGANLQRACQLSTDLASLVVRTRNLGLPKNRREVVKTLVGAGILESDLAARFLKVDGFQQSFLLGDREPDIHVMIDVIENRLDDLLEFAQIIVNLLSNTPPQGETS